jgi:hypothetical protein
MNDRLKKYLFTVSSVALLCAGVCAQDIKPEMSKLVWIAGCWSGGDKIQVEEQWTKLAGQSMLGVSRTIKEGKTVSFEFMQIREQSDGVFYIAQPNGGKAVPFKLVKVNDSQAVFENPEHDFPQRITYQRLPDGSLLAAIEGEEKGKMKRIEFPMRHVRCD